MAEDDDSALDTAMYQDIRVGSSRSKILVPVRLDEETGLSQVEGADTSTIDPKPEPGADPDYNMNPPPSDNLEHTTHTGQSKGRWERVCDPGGWYPTGDAGKGGIALFRCMF